jgi:hypothetical protein
MAEPLSGSKAENNQNLGRLPFPFSWINKPGCNQGTYNKDPSLSIHAKKISL